MMMMMEGRPRMTGPVKHSQKKVKGTHGQTYVGAHFDY